jgi:hypothetical protein
MQNAVSIMMSVNCASINPSELFLFPSLASVGSVNVPGDPGLSNAFFARIVPQIGPKRRRFYAQRLRSFKIVVTRESQCAPENLDIL